MKNDGIIKINYNWDMPLTPGAVVCSKYNNFNGEQCVGIFIVVYDEQLDSKILDNRNVIAIKVSTKGTCVSNYSCELDRNLNSFLDNDCIACCSKLHVLHKTDQIYKVIGYLHPATYLKVYKIFSRFTSELSSQMLSNL